MKFRLTSIAYVFALLAAAMATFGANGIAIAAGVLLFWFMSYRDPYMAFVAASIIGVMALLLIPAIADGRRPALRNSCMNNLKQVALGLENYHAAHGTYPPAYIADASGKPMHSWRVLILPYMERLPLYHMYDFKEPWDGPNNRKLWDLMPEVYRCPGAERYAHMNHQPFGKLAANAASYVAVVGDRTAWPGTRAVSQVAITDGLSETLTMIEYSGNKHPWTAPIDLTMEEALRLCESSDAKGHIFVGESFSLIRSREALASLLPQALACDSFPK